MSTSRAYRSEFFKTADGLTLYSEADEVAEPRAALLFVHGFQEHCGRYASMVSWLCELGFSCYRFDSRGHGRSEGRRGHIFQFEDHLRDLQAFRERVSQATPHLPRFLLSHSYGGLVALHSVAEDPQGLDGLVLSSPFFGFQIEVPLYKQLVARTLSRYVPSLALPSGLSASLLTHDPAAISAHGMDPLIHRVASSRWFTETVAAHERAPAKAPSVTLPILFQLAGDDRIASTPSARAIFELLSSEDRTCHEYPGLFHEIWFELERERPLSDLKAWLEAHLVEPRPDAA